MTVPRLALAALCVLPAALAPAAHADDAELGDYSIPDEAMCEMRARWLDRVAATYPADTWAPLKWEPTNEDLALVGLPGGAWFEGRTFDAPTAVHPDGTTLAVELPAVAAYAGAGCFGIRPGAFLLLLEGGIGWCSLAHVYGSEGSYSISTAGHCGKVGDRATVIAAFSNDGVPILLDFGTFSKSVDNGIGNDWALISVAPAYQHLVSPTMCGWGGPIGVFTKTGATVGVSIPNRIGQLPTVSTSTDPLLPQLILHYGHGTGTGQVVGTPRIGLAIDWRPTYVAWFGAISPGDSGSASNTATGDAIGAMREAAGINTHIYVDGLQLFKTGTGFLASTRATSVSAPIEDGQLLPYPAPIDGAP